MKDGVQYLNVMLETACAEFGSALEMLTACKLSQQQNFAYGYFEHAKDEYNHTKTFLSLLSRYGREVSSDTARDYRFNSTSLITKGYLSREGYLIETMHIKDFIAYVYTNELLAKESFEGILKLVDPNTSEGEKIIQIMDDELRHHGLAEQHFLKYYPRLQPWQLRLYRLKETISNYSRKFYDKNLKFLDKLLKPLYYFMAFLTGKILILVDLREFNRNGRNLMQIKSKSVV
tara:strand:+ start:277 stop:972 length:696 start_codon:yes stop_codon:yes gene_type:complete